MVDLYFRKIGLTGDTSGIQVDFFVNLLLKEDRAFTGAVTAFSHRP